MGNYFACISFLSPPSTTIHVFHPQHGFLPHLHHPIKVAELMLQSPNHFVSSSSLLTPRQRITPLPADHDLKPQHTYILIPMSKLHSRLSPHDVALFSPPSPSSSSRGGTGRKHSRKSKRKVAPLRVDSLSLDIAQLEKHTGVSQIPVRALSFQAANIVDSSGLPHLIVRSKSWIPKLETISERALM